MRVSTARPAAVASQPQPRTAPAAAAQSTGHASTSSFAAAPPAWTKAPLAANGEGKFAGKTAHEIANLGWDEIKSASPRELYSLRHNQLPGVDAIMGNFDKDLSKDQRRAYLRAKIRAGIFEDMMKLMQKHNRIAG